jgi:hypothetical protein
MPGTIPTKPKGYGACPSFFFARCREASYGGDCGYHDAGRTLATHLYSLNPFDVEEADWCEKVEQLKRLLLTASGASDEAVLSWFQRWLPRCLALVPPRRRSNFLDGLRAAARDREIEN